MGDTGLTPWNAFAPLVVLALTAAVVGAAAFVVGRGAGRSYTRALHDLATRFNTEMSTAERRDLHNDCLGERQTLLVGLSRANRLQLIAAGIAPTAVTFLAVRTALLLTPWAAVAQWAIAAGAALAVAAACTVPLRRRTTTAQAAILEDSALVAPAPPKKARKRRRAKGQTT